MTLVNGNLQLTGYEAGDMAIFECEADYKLVGDLIRECLSNYTWSGVEASCAGKREGCKENYNTKLTITI